MKPILKDTTLLTDLYQLTMIQSYYLDNRGNDTASFDYFFRKIPYDGAYVVFAGLNEILHQIELLKFTDEDLSYLDKIGFKSEFLKYLDSFSFKGNVDSMEEGSLVYPNEPIISVSGNLIECQLIETILLNTINFYSLIATKAARMRLAAGNRILSDFGLRRSHGLGGIQASHASILGGFDSTSNVYAAHNFGLKAVGTMAHSYIQSYDDELTAFRKFAESHPENCTLLIDTYDTIKSGLKNAIIVAKEMEKVGNKLNGVRLDSGDLILLSKEVRKKLDEERLEYVKIVASNQLDEFAIEKLIKAHAPIDIFGVGTSLVTGQPDSALDGVYKLAQINEKPSIKLSENEDKITLPGLKQVYRFSDDEGNYIQDIITLKDESIDDEIKSNELSAYKFEKLLNPVMEDGKSKIQSPTPNEIKKKVSDNLAKLSSNYKRFELPEKYKIRISKELKQVQDELKQSMLNNLK